MRGLPLPAVCAVSTIPLNGGRGQAPHPTSLGVTLSYKQYFHTSPMQLKPLFTFLTALTKHNDRAWFQERKPT